MNETLPSPQRVGKPGGEVGIIRDVHPSEHPRGGCEKGYDTEMEPGGPKERDLTWLGKQAAYTDKVASE